MHYLRKELQQAHGIVVCCSYLRILEILVVREGEPQGESWCISLWVADDYVCQVLQRMDIALQYVRANVGVRESFQPELLDASQLSLQLFGCGQFLIVGV